MGDKLIELIADAPYGLRTLGQAADELISVERIADYFIANGVIAQQWIPVSERLPKRAISATGKRTCPSSDEVLVYVERTGAILIAEYWHDGGFWEEPEENQTIWNVTHWMPLPEPPKDGE